MKGGNSQPSMKTRMIPSYTFRHPSRIKAKATAMLVTITYPRTPGGAPAGEKFRADRGSGLLPAASAWTGPPTCGGVSRTVVKSRGYEELEPKPGAGRRGGAEARATWIS